MFVGIDVGKKGCLCLLSDNGEVTFYDFPQKESEVGEYFRAMAEIYQTKDVKFTIIEKVHAMPGQGVTSMFTFGANFGYWNALLMLANTSYDLVTPQKWMKFYNISKADGGTTKERVLTVCKRLYPKAELHGSKGGYKDGRGDALLLAHYAKNSFKGE